MTDRRETGRDGVEARLTRAIRTAGALSYKLAPTVAGIPDRLVIWPGGYVDFIEVKAHTGRTSPIQRARHTELRRQGASVYVLYGDDDVDEYVAASR